MRNLLVSFFLCLAIFAAQAQSGPGQIPAGTVLGNSGSSQAVPFPLPITGIDQNVLNAVTANYTIAATDCGKTIQAGTGATGQFTITLPAVGGFPANCAVVVKNGDVGRGKKIAGFPGEVGTMLWPLQAVGVKITNGTWSSYSNPGRWLLKPFGNINFFIDLSLGSDTNDGLAAGAGAFGTYNGGIAKILDSVDSQSQSVIIKLASGQAWSNFVIQGHLTGGGIIYTDLNGNNVDGTNAGTGAAIYVNGGNANIILAAFYSSVAGASITCTTGLYGLAVIAGQAGLTAIGGPNSNISMGNCPGGTHFLADSPFARVVALANYSITGSAQNHWSALNGGHADFDSLITVTCVGNPAFAGGGLGPGFGLAYNMGILVNNDAFTGCGGVTGIKYSAVLGGRIIGNATFPGSVAGISLFGGGVNGPGVPTISSCGTGAAVNTGSTDTSGSVVEGPSATGCFITFSTNNAPAACIVTSNSALINSTLNTAISTTALAFNHSADSGKTVYWVCPPKGN